MQKEDRPIINIRGERVALGPVRDDQLEQLGAWDNDYAVARNLGTLPGPQRPEQVRAFWVDGLLADATTVLFAIYELASWRCIGVAGLMHIDHANRSAEFLIVIGAAEARGQGYGTEATRLVLDHAFVALGLHSVRLDVSAYNLAGVRAYEKAGFKLVGRLRQNKSMGGRLWDTIVMDALADEFASPVLARVLVADEPRQRH
jgi:RimJ/RimL family protein N-acetyltransferase